VSVYDENGVPIVYRGPDQRIGLSEPLVHDDELLLGESVVIHCKSLAVAPGEEGHVSYGIGAENLDEALKSVIGAFDIQHLHPPGESSDAEHTPDWVASTHAGLAERSPTTTPARRSTSRRPCHEHATHPRLVDYQTPSDRGVPVLQWAITELKLREAGVPVNAPHERRPRRRLCRCARVQPGRRGRHDRRVLLRHRHDRAGGGHVHDGRA
jgi:hypothetical protein